MAVKTKNGIVLRNPAEKAKRYAKQLKTGKVSETGKELTGADKAFRAGYLTARNDNSKAFRSNVKKNFPLTGDILYPKKSKKKR